MTAVKWHTLKAWLNDQPHPAPQPEPRGPLEVMLGFQSTGRWA